MTALMSLAWGRPSIDSEPSTTQLGRLPHGPSTGEPEEVVSGVTSAVADGGADVPALQPGDGASAPARHVIRPSGRRCIERLAFVLDEQIVPRYFEFTKNTNENDAHHTLDYSPCQAEGEVVFENGQSGQWKLTQTSWEPWR